MECEQMRAKIKHREENVLEIYSNSHEICRFRIIMIYSYSHGYYNFQSFNALLLHLSFYTTTLFYRKASISLARCYIYDIFSQECLINDFIITKRNIHKARMIKYEPSEFLANLINFKHSSTFSRKFSTFQSLVEWNLESRFFI